MKYFYIIILCYLVNYGLCQNDSIITSLNLEISRTNTSVEWKYIYELQNNTNESVFLIFYPKYIDVDYNKDSTVISLIEDIGGTENFIIDRLDTLYRDMKYFYIGSIGFSGTPAPPGYTIIEVKPKSNQIINFIEKNINKNIVSFNIVVRYGFFKTKESAEFFKKGCTNKEEIRNNYIEEIYLFKIKNDTIIEKKNMQNLKEMVFPIYN